ncbi:Gfo/Idh/MocA family protein [Halorubrum saccharovorum]|nr:Gfo/Idh/MocA family oxidoreductase [Halorubrum saccharovorum]
MTVTVGMLGYRFMGKAHSNAFARLPMFFPEAPEIERDILVGRDEEALADAADRLGFSRTTTDWQEAIDAVDVFYNVGPNHVHAEPAIAALEAGVPVLCEKPLAATTDDAERMAAAADDADVPTAIAFNYRYVPAIRYAKELIDDGVLGEIHHVRATYLQDWLVDPQAPWSWRNSEELAGSGALGDLGAHSIDLAQFLLGDRIERVSGHLHTFVDERPVPGEGGGGLDAESQESVETREVTVDDAYSAQAVFEGGAMGTFEASRFANGRKNAHTIEVNGSEGSLRFDLERLNELEVLRGDDRGFETVLVTDPDDPYIDHWWPPGHTIGWEHTFVHEDYEFLTAVAEGSEYHPNFQDGLAVQRVLDAISRSDETDRWTEI